MHYFSKYFFSFLSSFPNSHFRHIFHKMGKLLFAIPQFFTLWKVAFVLLLLRDLHIRRCFILRKKRTKKKLSAFNIYYFQLCFLYISGLRNLYNFTSAQLCWCDFRSAEERPQRKALLVCFVFIIFLFFLFWLYARCSPVNLSMAKTEKEDKLVISNCCKCLQTWLY